MIKNIYGNGCSFMSDWEYKDTNQANFLDLLGKQHSLTVHNAGKPGSCNQRIIRSSMRDAITLDNETLMVIQLTFLHRTEKFSEVTAANQWKFDFQDFKESVKPYKEKEIHNQSYAKEFIKQFNELAEFVCLTSSLLGLTSFLKLRKIPYFIFAYQPLMLNPSESIKDSLLYHELSKDNCILELLQDSLISRLGQGDWYWDANGTNGEIGHLNSNGHKAAFKLINHLIIPSVSQE